MMERGLETVLSDSNSKNSHNDQKNTFDLHLQVQSQNYKHEKTEFINK